MYKLQKIPDSAAYLTNGSKVTPLITLADDHGGLSHIIEDDHCYVLINDSGSGKCGMSCHWYPEAIEALKTLPLPVPA